MAENQAMEWPRISATEFPHGVRCMDCKRLLGGQPYIERVAGFVEDTPTTEIVCVPCGGGATTS